MAVIKKPMAKRPRTMTFRRVLILVLMRIGNGRNILHNRLDCLLVVLREKTLTTVGRYLHVKVKDNC